MWKLHDYKQTINSAAPCDNYSILQTEELFATLKTGKTLSKLDLSCAYQQLELDNRTQQLLWIVLAYKIAVWSE